MNVSVFLTSLRGAPLSLFLAMAWCRSGDVVMTEGYLAGVVGYSPKTVREGLQVLINHGLAYRLGRFNGYDLTDYSVVLASTITATIVGSGESMREAEVNEPNIPARSVKNTARVNRSGPEYSYLQSVGIGEPTRSKILSLEWATLEYLKYHIENGLKNDDALGLIIHRIMNHDPVKRSKADRMADPDYYRKQWLK